MELIPEPEPVLQPSTEKQSFIHRLVNSVTKRKRSTPQKFLGEFFSCLYISMFLKVLKPNIALT